MNEIKSEQKTNLVNIVNDQAVADSRSVAEHFGKRHDHVMRDIETIIGSVPNFGETPMFFKTTYVHEQNGQTYPMYLMNRDGFSLLVMGFTGTKALEWKLKYIDAFNAMEEALNSRHNNNVMDIATVKKLVDKLDDTLSLISKGFETMRDNFNTVVEKHNKIIAILEGASAEVEEEYKNVNKEDITLRDDEFRLSDIAKEYGWLSTSGLPHVDFLKCVLGNALSFNVSTAYEHEDDNTRCVIYLDGTGRNICHLYLKNNGAELFNKWYFENKGGRTLRHAVTYQRNYRGHKPGDIRDIYYIVPGDKRQRHFHLDTQALLNS